VYVLAPHPAHVLHRVPQPQCQTVGGLDLRQVGQCHLAVDLSARVGAGVNPVASQGVGNPLGRPLAENRGLGFLRGSKWLSQNLGLPPRSIGEGQMEQGFVVRRLFLPADQDPPEAIHPRRDAFDHPAPGASAAGSFGGLFFTARLDMGTVTASAGFAAEGGGIVTLVAAQMLRTTRGGAGTADRKTVQRGMKELLVMHIGAGDGQPQGHAPTIGQHRTLDPQLAPIRGIPPGFFPRPRVPWCSIRPDSATAIGCPAGHRTVAAGTSRACGTDGVAPTPGSSGARNSRRRIPSAMPSIGNRCVRRRKYRWRLFADPTAGVRRAEIWGTWARRTPCGPKGHRECANSDTLASRAYEDPP